MTTEQGSPTAEAADRAVASSVGVSPIVAEYDSMLAQIPDAGGAGIEAILEQIAAANSAADLDNPWRAGGLGKYVDTPLVVTGVRKMPSDYTSGLSHFLIVDGAVRATGEKIAATTGSIAVVGQLVKAHALDAFPLAVIPRLAKRPTPEGYFPMHLEIIPA